MSMSRLRHLYNGYHSFLHSYPILTQSLQCSFLMGTGDVICQVALEEKNLKTLNYERLLKFTGIGFFFIGPVLQVWYTKLALVGGKSLYIKTLKKVGLDQLIAAPTLLCTVMSSVHLLDGHSLEETKLKLRQDYLDVLINNYKLWPAVQFLNFALVPVNFQVLVVQVVALAWNCYLSYKTHKKVEPEIENKENRG
ncbi:protein Mpv17 [Periplaneta americana]|uniref:protein Mpv17 n=1 Tax=Periplaneta americana TaxID=6978 RepID=UPI0037E7C60D